MNVTDGGSYCVRISASYKSGSPVIPFGVTHSVIEQVPCGKALVEAGKYRPLELKRIEPVVNVNVVSSQTFPNFKQ